MVQGDTCFISNIPGTKRLQAACLFGLDLQIPKESVRFGSGRENYLTANFRPAVSFYMIIHRPTVGRR